MQPLKGYSAIKLVSVKQEVMLKKKPKNSLPVSHLLR